MNMSLANTSAPEYMFCDTDSWLTEAVKSKPSMDLYHSTIDQYIVSLYYSTVTLVGVGYGEIWPRTNVSFDFVNIYMKNKTFY